MTKSASTSASATASLQDWSAYKGRCIEVYTQCLESLDEPLPQLSGLSVR